jgi:serine/threonine-protein kinase
MPPQSPTTSIGKYQILGLVGEGAMGAVYRALDPVLQRPVAIKVMSDAVAREQELRERFLREAQAAGSLQHPNVVTIYDFGEVDGHLFIAMEFLEGEDLETLLARQAPLSLPAKLGIAVDVLGGLSYAHKRGIVHRDIKPANIRIVDDERAKIMDFGVAHLTSQKMTRTGMTMGTPNYMAPELVSAGPIGAHTDVFSLGAVLYELLTSTKPFAAETLHAVLFRIVSEPTAPPSTRVAGLPPELDAIVLKSLAKDPAQRYQTASDMANDLTALRARLGTSRSVSLNARLTTAMPDAVPEIPSGGPATPTRASAGRGALLATGALTVVALGVGAWAFTRRDASVPPTTPTVPATVVAEGPAAAPAPGSTPNAPPSSTPVPTPPVAEPPASSGSVSSGATSPAAAPAPRPAPVPERRPAAASPRGGVPSTGGSAGASASAAVQTSGESPPPAAPVVAASVTGAGPAMVAGVGATGGPAPAARSTANAAAEIADVVARYARAITARDVDAMRAAYPGITPAQEANFRRFFASVRELRASFDVSGLDVDGASADARLNGAYDFVTQGGEKQRSPVNFQASFRRDGDRWLLVAVR